MSFGRGWLYHGRAIRASIVKGFFKHVITPYICFYFQSPCLFYSAGHVFVNKTIEYRPLPSLVASRMPAILVRSTYCDVTSGQGWQLQERELTWKTQKTI